MKHYIAICIEEASSGGWRVLFPDVPGCETKVHDLANLAHLAAIELARWVEERGLPLPADGAVERGNAWLAQNKVDISKAIVTMVAVP